MSAQTNHEVTLARALFEEGVALADHGDWAGAADRFERAHILKPTPGIAFNWASALSEVGRLMQACELLEAVIRDPKSTPELRAESEKKLAEIAPRRARLKLQVDSSFPAESELRVDGNVWPRAAWGVAIPVDPGAHEATCVHGIRELCHESVTLAEGELRELSLMPASSSPPQSAPAEQSQDRAPTKARPLYKNWILWTAVGAAVVAGVVAVSVTTAQRGEKTEAPIPGNTEPGIIRW